jgi:hypothetical protein
MPNESVQHVARIDKHELSEWPAEWSSRDRGQYLRLLLRLKGIDPERLYQTAYDPCRRCWVLTQLLEPAPGTSVDPPPSPPDDAFFVQTLAVLRRTALSAFAALAAQSRHFACSGDRKYELPPKPEEVTPARLADLLGGPDAGGPAVSFDGEGGWRGGARES